MILLYTEYDYSISSYNTTHARNLAFAGEDWDVGFRLEYVKGFIGGFFVRPSRVRVQSLGISVVPLLTSTDLFSRP